MMFFGAAALIVLCGWIVVVMRIPTSRSIRKEQLIYIMWASSCIVFGQLVGSLTTMIFYPISLGFYSPAA